jgi:hypothetical protein
MAPLIMVTLPTVSSFFSICWCFLRDGRSSAGDLPPLSLACGWPFGSNGSLFREWRRLQGLRVEDPSGARKGGPNRHSAWARPAGLGWPTHAHPGPARSPLRFRGSSCDYALCPLHPHHFDDVILASKMEVLRAWSSVFYTSILGDLPLSHFGPRHHWKWFHQAHEHEQDFVIAPLKLLWILPLCPCFST